MATTLADKGMKIIALFCAVCDEAGKADLGVSLLKRNNFGWGR